MSAVPPTTQPRRSVAAWRVLLVTVFFFLIGAGIWAMNRAGVSWALLEGRLANHPAHQVESALFRLRERTTGGVCVAMGDAAFLDRLAQRGGGSAPWIRVQLPRFSFRQVQRIAAELEPGRLRGLIVQNHPAYWSNYRMKDAGLRLGLWNRLDARWPGLFPKADVKAFFEGLRDWARAPSQAPAGTARLGNLDELRFQAERSEREDLARTLERHDLERVIWIEDAADVDYESNAPLVSAFRAYLAGPEAARLGRFMDMNSSSLPEVLHRCQDGVS